MRSFSFAASSLLASIGVAVSVLGVVAEEVKPIGAGLIMLMGAVVFALLYRGCQLPAQQNAFSDTTREHEL